MSNWNKERREMRIPLLLLYVVNASMFGPSRVKSLKSILSYGLKVYNVQLQNRNKNNKA